MFKQRKGKSKEKESLLKGNPGDNKAEEEDEKGTVGCINSWLLAVFIKIFD